MIEPPLVDPRQVLQQVASALPPELLDQVIVIGSLAAGYHYFADSEQEQVRTKDIDCLLSPYIEAVAAAERIADRLFEKGWTLRTEGEWNQPGGAETPEDQLPLIRLRPAEDSPWFIELLGGSADSGLVELLRPENYEDLDEAYYTCVNGLLVGLKPDLDTLRVTGERLLQDALRPMAKLADSA